jgi:probable HAF family extracellular repeat protein
LNLFLSKQNSLKKRTTIVHRLHQKDASMLFSQEKEMLATLQCLERSFVNRQKSTKLKMSILPTLMCSLFAGHAAAEAGPYRVTDLGTLGGDGTAQALGINEAGQVVGYATAVSLKYYAFLWDDGVMTDLGTLPTGSTSRAIGLNDNGQVVGFAFDGSAAGGAHNHAFLWENGVMTDLFPEPAHSVANAINDAGQVVGQYNLNRPYIWQDGGFIELGSFGGGNSWGYALDINNAGQVVGSSPVNNGSGGLAQHAFLWEDGVMIDLGALPGLPDSRAHAVNELGQVVGFSSFFDPDTTDELFESFLWEGGVMIDLGVPGDLNRAHDINDSGQIVGWSSSGAYIYEDGVVTILNTLIPAGSGVRISVATGINNAGQIVGYGLFGGRFHALLLTPAEEDTPSVSIDDVSVAEGNAGLTDAVFTVTLSEPASENVTVNYTTANGTASAGADYIAASGTVTIPDGLSSATVTVSVIGDTATEPDETFQLNLSQAVGATISDGQGVGTIVDDEPLFLTIDDVTMQEGRFGTREFVFTVTLSAASGAPVTVNYGTADGTAVAGSDYNAQSGVLTFAPGQATKTIRIAVKGDRKREADETFFVNLSNVVGAHLQDIQGVGTILNDDR